MKAYEGISQLSIILTPGYSSCSLFIKHFVFDLSSHANFVLNFYIRLVLTSTNNLSQGIKPHLSIGTGSMACMQQINRCSYSVVFLGLQF